MNIVRLLSLNLMLVAVQLAAKEPTPVERDGFTKEKAIIITAESDFAGTYKKHQWILQHYPSAHFDFSALVHDHDRYYDLDTFTTTDGKKRTLWFDITQNFGKW